jgi:hypothetical protein
MKRTLSFAALCLVSISLALHSAHAQPTETADASKEEKPYSFQFKPVVLDTGSSSGASLGLDYDFKAKYKFAGGQTSVGSDTISLADLNATFRSAQIDLRARGTLASSKERNPNKLLDFLGLGVYRIDTPAAYYKLGALVAYETDQGFDNKQYMVGLAASASKVTIFTPGDAGSVLLNFGNVNPSTDAQREKLLGSLGSLSSFKRWNLELSYSVPINKSKVRSIDFNYRHYQEISPPAAIRDADLDRYRIGLIRINLDQDFFVQYSRGSLPFDQRSERTIKLGWSLKFE